MERVGGSRERKRAWLYWTSVTLTMLVLHAVLFVILWRVGGQEAAGFFGCAFLLFLGISRQAATDLCRWQGVSNAGTLTEFFFEPVITEQNVGRVIEIRPSQIVWKRLSAAVTILTLLLFGVWISRRFVPGTEVVGALLTTGFGIMAVVMWRKGNAPGAVGIYADDAAITGLHDGLRRKTVEWPQVAACEVTSSFDVFGKRERTIVVFTDLEGRVLLRTISLGMTVPPIDTLIDYLRARFARQEAKHSPRTTPYA
jgi:hypothetical protein